MPSFKSINGLWDAAHERAFDPKSGEIYDGPDREALKYIKQEGGTVGQDATKDPQVLQAARNMGFQNVESYLEHFKPTEKQLQEIKAAQLKVVTHALPEQKEGVTGGTKGGFNEDDETPTEVMTKRSGRPRKG